MGREDQGRATRAVFDASTSLALAFSLVTPRTPWRRAATSGSALGCRLKPTVLFQAHAVADPPAPRRQELVDPFPSPRQFDSCGAHAPSPGRRQLGEQP